MSLVTDLKEQLKAERQLRKLAINRLWQYLEMLIKLEESYKNQGLNEKALIVQECLSIYDKLNTPITKI